MQEWGHVRDNLGDRSEALNSKEGKAEQDGRRGPEQSRAPVRPLHPRGLSTTQLNTGSVESPKGDLKMQTDLRHHTTQSKKVKCSRVVFILVSSAFFQDYLPTSKEHPPA